MRGRIFLERLAVPVPLGLTALCIAPLLMETTCLAGTEVTAAAQVIPATQSGQTVEALLGKAEQQIAGGHTVIPPADNALQTWERVTVKALSASPETRSALVDFAARMRNRAADEKAAGRLTVSLDFMVFADLATNLLNRRGAAGARAVEKVQAATPPDASDDTANGSTASVTPSETSPAPPPNGPQAAAPAADAPANPGISNIPAPDAGATPGPSPPSDRPAAANPGVAATPEVNPIRQPAAASTPAPPPLAPPRQVPPASSVATTPAVPDKAMAALFASRGDQMLANRDIWAARKFYEYAANAGNAHGALGLARTLDPVFLAQLGVVGPRPDAALAAMWYRKVEALNEQDRQGGPAPR